VNKTLKPELRKVLRYLMTQGNIDRAASFSLALMAGA
jgi:hypothetical protein